MTSVNIFLEKNQTVGTHVFAMNKALIRSYFRIHFPHFRYETCLAFPAILDALQFYVLQIVPKKRVTSGTKFPRWMFHAENVSLVNMSQSMYRMLTIS
jgi:hypothetical protein